MNKTPTFLQKFVRTSDEKLFDVWHNDWFGSCSRQQERKYWGKILSSRAGVGWGESAANNSCSKGTFPCLLKCRLRLEKKCLYMSIRTFWGSCSMLLCVPWSAKTVTFCSCEEGIWGREWVSQMSEWSIGKGQLRLDFFALGHCWSSGREACWHWYV